MTEYWVSNAKHWCKICKIFIDAKPRSIKTHENGKTHIEKNRLFLEERRKARRLAKQESDEAKRALDEINAAAMASYQKDIAAGFASDSNAPKIRRSRQKRWGPPTDRPNQMGMGQSGPSRDGFGNPVAQNIVAFYNQRYHEPVPNSNIVKPVADGPPGVHPELPPGIAPPPGLGLAPMKEDSKKDGVGTTENKERESVSQIEIEEKKSESQIDQSTGFGVWETVEPTPPLDPAPLHPSGDYNEHANGAAGMNRKRKRGQGNHKKRGARTWHTVKPEKKYKNDNALGVERWGDAFADEAVPISAAEEAEDEAELGYGRPGQKQQEIDERIVTEPIVFKKKKKKKKNRKANMR